MRFICASPLRTVGVVRFSCLAEHALTVIQWAVLYGAPPAHTWAALAVLVGGAGGAVSTFLYNIPTVLL